MGFPKLKTMSKLQIIFGFRNWGLLFSVTFLHGVSKIEHDLETANNHVLAFRMIVLKFLLIAAHSS